MSKLIALTQLRIVLVVVLSFCLMQAAQAITLTSTASITERTGVRYYFTITNWSLTDRTPSACDGWVPPWGEAGVRRCRIQVGLVGSNRGMISPYALRWDVVFSEIPLSNGQLLSLMIREGFSIPFQGSAFVPVRDALATQPTCIVLGVDQNDGEFTECYPLIPPTAPPVRCDLAGSTNIDHKVLSDTALNGAQASTRLNIKCDGSASIIVKATRTNSYGVSLRGDSLYSEVKINDRDATYGINISVIGNLGYPIDVTSTLRTRGMVASGPFSGSTVITVSPN